MKNTGPIMGHPRRTVNRPARAFHRRLRTPTSTRGIRSPLTWTRRLRRIVSVSPPAESKAARPAKTILTVDDDRYVTDTFARMLRLEGFTVHTALNAKSGLELAAAKHPDAIILDLRMPILSGLHFLQRLRSRPRLHHIPVAIVTGDYFVEADVTTELKELGALLRFKPIWLDDLVTLARSLVAS